MVGAAAFLAGIIRMGVLDRQTSSITQTAPHATTRSVGCALGVAGRHDQLHGIIYQGRCDEPGGVLVRYRAPFDVNAGPLAVFVDVNPLTINTNAPLEMLAEMFYRLGSRPVVIVEEGSSGVPSVVLKQQFVMHLEHLRAI
ncbi:hypothetical protein V8F20_009098 [Naviculisporaceae sp. PSN 640]